MVGKIMKIDWTAKKWTFQSHKFMEGEVRDKRRVLSIDLFKLNRKPKTHPWLMVLSDIVNFKVSSSLERPHCAAHCSSTLESLKSVLKASLESLIEWDDKFRAQRRNQLTRQLLMQITPIGVNHSSPSHKLFCLSLKTSSTQHPPTHVFISQQEEKILQMTFGSERNSNWYKLDKWASRQQRRWSIWMDIKSPTRSSPVKETWREHCTYEHSIPIPFFSSA